MSDAKKEDPNVRAAQLKTAIETIGREEDKGAIRADVTITFKRKNDWTQQDGVAERYAGEGLRRVSK